MDSKCKEVDDYPFDDTDSDGERHMTRAEWEKYTKQCEESEGFEVDGIPDVSEFHQIMPVDLTDPAVLKECELLARLTIEKFNNTEHKEKVGDLEFVQMLTAMGQASRGIMYYMTFSAKIIDKKTKKKSDKEGTIMTYQAVALSGIFDERDLLAFRPKPSDGVENMWFWKHHLDWVCDCKG